MNVPDAGAVVISSAARDAMAMLRPAAWMVLHDLALDAVWHDGQLVAASSARLVASHLHLDPATAASALRVLRSRGVVEMSQASGPNGRFGLAVYTLHLPAGVDVLRADRADMKIIPAVDLDDNVLRCPPVDLDTSPYAASPHAVEPHAVEPHAVEPHAVEPHAVTPRGDRVTMASDLAGAASRMSRRDSGGSRPRDVDLPRRPDPPSTRRRSRRAENTAPLEQGAFDLGPGAQ